MVTRIFLVLSVSQLDVGTSAERSRILLYGVPTRQLQSISSEVPSLSPFIWYIEYMGCSEKLGEFLGRDKVPCHTLSTPCYESYDILWAPSRGLISRYNDAGIVRVPGTAPALAGLLLRARSLVSLPSHSQGRVAM